MIPKELKTSDRAIITRFPPEPSGFLHIGHVKAIMANYNLANSSGHADSKFLMRFDDTNPVTESDLFEKSIIEDMELLGVKYDQLSYASDYFDVLEDLVTDLIKRGLAYTEKSDSTVTAEQKRNKSASIWRDQDKDVVLSEWQQMKEGLLDACIRIKLDPTSNNGCMRDPVIYRVVNQVHHRTGKNHVVYPTYDFACPVTDHLEHVTHVLRSTQFTDRNEQYAAIFKLCYGDSVCPVLYNYGLVNFVGVDVSKRRIKKLVEDGKVSGFDDPRLATIKGVINRGLSIEVLKQFMLTIAYSKRDVTMEWDKIWAENRKYIDVTATRICSIDIMSTKLVSVDLPEEELGVADVLINPNKRDVGVRPQKRSRHVMIESISDGDVFLQNWRSFRLEGSYLIPSDINVKDIPKDRRIPWISSDDVTSAEVIHFQKNEDGDVEMKIGSIYMESWAMNASEYLQPMGGTYFKVVSSIPLRVIEVPHGNLTSLIY